MEVQTLMTVLLGVLVVVAGVQTFVLLGLSSAVASGGVKVGSASSGDSSGSSGSDVPSVLQDIPSQIGGC